MLIEKISTKKKVLAFRLELSETIGLGHYMRCLNLASLLSNDQNFIVFIFSIQSYKSFVKLSLYKDFKFKIFVLDNDNYEISRMSRSLFSKVNVELMIIDHYSWDIKKEKECRELFAKKILVFDDLADRKHDCDFLIDLSFKRKKKDYLKLVPNYSKIFLGPEYVPLKKSYYNLRKKIKKRTVVKKILISFGGTDPHDLTSLVISALEEINNIEKITIILNKLSPNFKKISRIVKLNKKFELISKCFDLSNYYAESDLCVGASGFSSWERCFLGLPTIVITSADNQNFIAKKLFEMQAIALCSDYKNVNKQKIVATMNDIILNNRIHSMSESAGKVFSNLRIDKILVKILDL